MILSVIVFFVRLICPVNLCLKGGGPAWSFPPYHYGFGAATPSLLLRGCCLQLGVGKLFVLLLLFARYALEQQFALFRSNVLIAAHNSVQCSQASALECSKPRDERL